MKNVFKEAFYGALVPLIKSNRRTNIHHDVEPVPPETDVDALRKKWKRSAGPKINMWSIDYSYYSPIEYDAPVDRKYPMIIVMAGAIEGIIPGYELAANCMALWTDEKYQSRFNGGHAFMFIPRAPEEHYLYWDSKKLIPSLKAAIDDFIRAHENVDTSRIYLIGWCLGGCGAINLITDAPNSFAASIIIAPDNAITKKSAPSFATTPIWLMGCARDEYIPFNKSAGASYDALQQAGLNIDFLLTTFNIAPDVYLGDKLLFIRNHNMWAYLAEDMQYSGPGYDQIITCDQNGKIILTPTAIEWLNSHVSLTPYEFGVDQRAYTFRASHFQKGYGKTFLRAKGIDILIEAMVRLGWSIDARKLDKNPFIDE